MSTQNAASSLYNYSGVDEGASNITQSGAGKFPNPFCDIASEYVPRDLDTIFSWCEYITLAVTPFRSVSQRVVRYFLTELVLDGQSGPERDKYDDFLNNKLHILQQLGEIGDDYMCFHGDTPVPTRNGVYPISALAGRTVDVLNVTGKYTPATFKSHGTQKLLEVRLANGESFLATPEHEWKVRHTAPALPPGAKTTLADLVTVPTTKLRGCRVPLVVADRPERGVAFYEGVRHGITHGDGSLQYAVADPGTTDSRVESNDKVAVVLTEAKKELLEYFSDYEVTEDHGKGTYTVSGLPLMFSWLPDSHASAEYWYGFVCGVIAIAASVLGTRGVTHRNGVHLPQWSKPQLLQIIEHLPRFGMTSGPICEYTDPITGRTDTKHPVPCTARLTKRFLITDDFLLAEHRRRFVPTVRNACGATSRCVSVTETGIESEVYCCVEPETHTFVIGNGVLTGNCYGNSFVSIYFPFDRFLTCPNCGMSIRADRIAYKFSSRDCSFTCDCPKCQSKGVKMQREDRKSQDTDRVRLIRWNPKDIRLRVHHISGKTEYYMRLDPRFVTHILEGDPFYVNDTPWGMIKACAKNGRGGTNYLFKFADDSIYHMKAASLAGLPIKGWAIPPLLPNFKLAYYVQLLRRYDEAIALDFILPFRVLFPTATVAGADPLSSQNMGSFIAQMQNMVANRRKNLTDIQIAPYSIGYEMLGGEAKSLAPKDNIALAVDELLNAMGFPAELYKGTLALQAFPVALRLFEQQWGSLVGGFNEFLAWAIGRISRHYMWGDMSGELRSVTLADDMERKAFVLQGAAGMDISKQTAYRPMGIDYMEEQKNVVDEQAEVQRLQQEAMEQQQAQQAAGQGGSEGGPGGQAGATPGDVYEQAKALAEQLLIQTPETMRRGELIKIKHSNPTLHALVLQEMDTMRQDMARQGQAMVMEQAKQASANGVTGAQDAEIIGYGPAKSLPSPLRVGLLLAEQIMDYNRGDLRKMAMDIKNEVPLAKEAFSYIYQRMKGIK